MLKEFFFSVTQEKINPEQLGAQLRGANIRGFADGVGINHDLMQVQIWADEDLTSAEIATVESILAAYVYTPPAPPSDPAGFIRALGGDPAISDATRGALFTDWRVNAGLLALNAGDLPHLQAQFAAVQAAPPAGVTRADLAEVVKLATASGIPLAPPA